MLRTINMGLWMMLVLFAAMTSSGFDQSEQLATALILYGYNMAGSILGVAIAEGAQLDLKNSAPKKDIIICSSLSVAIGANIGASMFWSVAKSPMNPWVNAGTACLTLLAALGAAAWYYKIKVIYRIPELCLGMPVLSAVIVAFLCHVFIL